MRQKELHHHIHQHISGSHPPHSCYQPTIRPTDHKKHEKSIRITPNETKWNISFSLGLSFGACNQPTNHSSFHLQRSQASPHSFSCFKESWTDYTRISNIKMPDFLHFLPSAAGGGLSGSLQMRCSAWHGWLVAGERRKWHRTILIANFYEKPFKHTTHFTASGSGCNTHTQSHTQSHTHSQTHWQ